MNQLSLSPETRRFLIRFLLRDPDPLWRWTSGQYARRWWGHGLFWAAIVSAGFLGLVTLSIAFEFFNPKSAASIGALFPSLRGAALPPSLLLAIFGVGIVYLIQFVLVTTAPFRRLDTMGGLLMLRDVWMTGIPQPRIGRLLYWGALRASALPWLLTFYLAVATLVMLTLTTYGEVVEPFRELARLTSGMTSYSFIRSGWSMSSLFLGPFVIVNRYPAAALLVCLVKPLFDHPMNLAISSWLLFKSGRRGHAQTLALTLIFLFFPALAFLLPGLVIQGTIFFRAFAWDFWAYEIVVLFLLVGWTLLALVRQADSVRPFWRRGGALIGALLAANIGLVTLVPWTPLESPSHFLTLIFALFALTSLKLLRWVGRTPGFLGVIAAISGGLSGVMFFKSAGAQSMGGFSGVSALPWALAFAFSLKAGVAAVCYSNFIGRWQEGLDRIGDHPW